MSIIDKAIAAVTPTPSESKRTEATDAARGLAVPGDWLSLVLDHHSLIREAFAAGRAARSAAERNQARENLALVLNGHSLAEEVVLYPALGQAGEKAHAAHAYIEQTAAKTQMAELETIAPSTSAWKDKWGHIEGAVLTHMYEEESGWFLELRDKAEDQDRLTRRYIEEYDRYVGPPRSGVEVLVRRPRSLMGESRIDGDPAEANRGVGQERVGEPGPGPLQRPLDPAAGGPGSGVGPSKGTPKHQTPPKGSGGSRGGGTYGNK